MAKKTNKHGSIRERSPGKWELQVSMGRNIYGKYPKVTRTHHGDEASALQALEELYNEVKLGLISTPGSMDMTELCRRYLIFLDGEIQNGNRHQSSVRAVRPAIWSHIAPRLKPESKRGAKASHTSADLGNMKVNKVTRPVVQAWVDDLATQALSARTIRNYVSVLSSIFKFARSRLGIEVNNPCRDLSLPVAHHKETDSFTEDEFRKLVDAVENMPENKKPYKVAFLILLFTGVRRSELAGLYISDIYNNTITIRRTLHYVNGRGLVEDTTKSLAGQRTITVPKGVMSEILDLIMIYYPELQDKYGEMWRATPYLLKRPRPYQNKMPGEPIDPRAIYREFHSLCIRNNIPPKGLHAVRHAHVSMLASLNLKDVSLMEIQHRVGHSKLSTTLDIYSHLFEEDHGEQIADELGKMFLVDDEDETK